MTLSYSEIAHRRLRTQGLSKIIFSDAVDAVTQLGAVQSQDYPGAKWALGQRLKDTNDADMDRLFNEGSILRTHVMRPTWHFVAPADIRWLLELTGPRVHSGNASWYRKLEIDKSILLKGYPVIERRLRDRAFATRAELAAALGNAGILAKGPRLAHLVMAAELDGLICSGPLRGKQFTYGLMAERAPSARRLGRDEALAELTTRYFRTRGPATLQDFGWWSGLTMRDAREGIESVRTQFGREEWQGRTYWFDGSASAAPARSARVFLLPNYDEYFIGHKDRSAIGEAIRRVAVPADSPVLYVHLIILDGQVVGGWRRTLRRNTVVVELQPLIGISQRARQDVARAAQVFGKFLGLSVELDWQAPWTA